MDRLLLDFDAFVKFSLLFLSISSCSAQYQPNIGVYQYSHRLPGGSSFTITRSFPSSHGLHQSRPSSSVQASPAQLLGSQLPRQLSSAPVTLMAGFVQPVSTHQLSQPSRSVPRVVAVPAVRQGRFVTVNHHNQGVRFQPQVSNFQPSPALNGHHLSTPFTVNRPSEGQSVVGLSQSALVVANVHQRPQQLVFRASPISSTTFHHQGQVNVHQHAGSQSFTPEAFRDSSRPQAASINIQPQIEVQEQANNQHHASPSVEGHSGTNAEEQPSPFSPRFQIGKIELTQDEWDNELLNEFRNSALIPGLVSETPKGVVNINYGVHACVHLGSWLVSEETNQYPSRVNYPAKPDQLYTLAMIEVPFGEFLPNSRTTVHWLVVNIPGTHVAKGQAVVPYTPPAASTDGQLGSQVAVGYNRKFVMMAWRQMDTVIISPDMLDQFKGCQGRDSFSLSRTVDLMKLETIPVAMNFFHQQQTRPELEAALQSCGQGF